MANEFQTEALRESSVLGDRQTASAHCPTMEETPVWVDASLERPCPVCGAIDGCAVMVDRAFARCGHVVSQWAMAAGGWLHRLAEQPAVTRPIRQAVEPWVESIDEATPASMRRMVAARG